MPKTNGALFDLVRKTSKNRSINSLIRLGRIIHYEALSKSHADDAIGPVIDQWSSDVSQSRYWTSAGQTEIKRNEAFVRVWRSAIGHAARNFGQLVDPSADRPQDTLGSHQFESAMTALAEDADRMSASRAKLDLLFGKHAGILGKEEDPHFIARLTTLWSAVSQMRHGAFHFSDMQHFLSKIRDTVQDASHADLCKDSQEIWTIDAAERLQKLKLELDGSHATAFFSQPQLNQVWGYITYDPTNETDGSDEKSIRPPLPRFRRMLLKAQNTWKEFKRPLGLPDVANAKDLEHPPRLSQYYALKSVYDAHFPYWLAKQSSEAINGWIDQAVGFTAERAQVLNGSDAVARAQQKIRVETDGGDKTKAGIRGFIDSLTELTTREFRVQAGYASSPEQAKKQASFLEDLNCDITALAFKAYCVDNKLEWLIALDLNRDLPSTKLSSTEKLPSLAEGEPENWQTVLYLVCHLIPVGEVGLLLNQLRRWSTGLPEDAADIGGIAELELVMSRYLDMHDAKFEGGQGIADSEALGALFETTELRDKLLASLGTDETDGSYVRTPKRGLRELMRFADLRSLKPAIEASPITLRQNSLLNEIEKGSAELQKLSDAQDRRQDLHKKLCKMKGEKPVTEVTEYRKALSSITLHRHLANHKGLVNHVRLHQLMMRVLGRLTDFSGMFERDLYFVFLALTYSENTSPDQALKPLPASPSDSQVKHDPRRKLVDGKIVAALRSNIILPSIQTHLERYFGQEFLDGRIAESRADIRNDLAHFGMLLPGQPALDLTAQVNRTRKLMSYDRKLKNAVSKSIVDLLRREKMILKWSITDHRLEKPEISSIRIKHLGDTDLSEDLHSTIFVEMVAKLFNGTCGNAVWDNPPDYPDATKAPEHSVANQIHAKVMASL